MSVITKKIQTPAKTDVKVDEIKSVIKLEDLLSRIEKLEKSGGYDSGYGAPDDKTLTPNPPPENDPKNKEEEEVPGVPGTKAKDGGAGNYDQGGYAAPVAKDKDDGDGDEDDGDGDEDDDGEMCTCSACGSSYKAKKEKKAEEEEKMEEEDTENVMPKKATGLDFGKTMKVLSPTKEELEAAKSNHFNKNELFGITKKQNNSIGRQMTQWAFEETARLTPSK